jgi:hypothetical protein
MKLDAKQKKFLLIGGAVVLGVYLISKWLHSFPKPQSADLQTDSLDKEKVLKKGSQGAEVVELQRTLKKDYNVDLGKSGVNEDGIDGDFGLLTEVALKSAKGVTEIALKDL